MTSRAAAGTIPNYSEELAMIMRQLNHRPRKRLNWKTPHEVFMQSLNRVALRD